MAAFKRCGDLGATYFRIVDRIQIFKCGFYDSDHKVRHVFLDYLLPKWLTNYKGNFLNLMGAIMLSSFEDDAAEWSELSYLLVEHFFKYLFFYYLLKVKIIGKSVR